MQISLLGLNSSDELTEKLEERISYILDDPTNNEQEMINFFLVLKNLE